MSILHQHPRIHFHLNQEILILMIAFILLLLALWVIGQSQIRPTERAVPQPIIAADQSPEPAPSPLRWIP